MQHSETLSPPVAIPSIIQTQIGRLRAALQWYVILDGVATFLLAAFAVFWLDLAMDRFFELPFLLRLGALALLLAAFGYAAWIRILRRVFANIKDEQIAMVFEHFTPSLDESLITTIELSATSETDDKDFSPVFFEQTVRQAAKSLKNVNVRKFLKYGRLYARIAAAFFAVTLFAGFCYAFPATMEIWFSRNILLSDTEWPRRSRLVLDGFSPEKRVRVAQGDSFTVTVRAEMQMPLVPDNIRLRLGTKESGYRTILIDQFRTEKIDGSDWRLFSYTFLELLETLPMTVRGADSTLRDYVIEVVPPPILTDIKIKQEFPAYMGREPRIIAPASRTMLPEGSTVQIDAQTNKPVVKCYVSVNQEEPVLLRQASEQTAFQSVTYTLPAIRKDTRVEFYLEDIDRLKNRQPLRLDFSPLKDQPPNINARLDGIGSAITQNAVLPVLGEITDDYGLQSAHFCYNIDFAPKATVESEMKSEFDPTETKATESETETNGSVPIPGIGVLQTVFPIDRQFSVVDCNVKPGDKLALRVEAADRFDLPPLDSEESVESGNAGDANVGTGSQWVLEVVTPEKLLGLLEVREISLRQRLEVLIGEVELTRGLVEEISLDIPDELQKEAEKLAEEMTKTIHSNDANQAATVNAEIEKKKTTLLETIATDQAAKGKHNISRSQRDVQKETYELRTILDSFRQIRKEMVNNQIFSPETAERLDGRIIEPMKSIVETDFAEADRRLSVFGETLDIRDKPLRTAAVSQRNEAIEQLNLIVRKMTAIRDSMVTMESFNEVIELLRTIIKEQQNLRNETQTEKNQQLKKLIE